MTTARADTASERSWRETAKVIVQALVLAMIIRTFFYEPFNIPSGSMKSTMLVGDYLFVSKLSYGYSRYTFPWDIVPLSGRIFASEPKRGDVVVFRLPRDTSKHYIKRLIGLPGDRVEVRNGSIYINGQAAPQLPAGEYVGPEETGPKPRYEETLPNGVKHYVLHWKRETDLDNVGPFDVPQGQYFMMGDNRDDSIDSRVPAWQHGVGLVPAENLLGRADIIFFSAATDDPGAFRLTSPGRWPFDIRWGRFFHLIR
jgi:signal peptidase I